MKAITNREVKALLRNVITKGEKAMHLGVVRNDDLLGLLLESNQSYSEEEGNTEKSRLTIDDVIEGCRFFYFVGQEASAMLTLMVVVLSMHQTWRKQAGEVLRLFSRSKPEFEGLSSR